MAKARYSLVTGRGSRRYIQVSSSPFGALVDRNGILWVSTSGVNEGDAALALAHQREHLHTTTRVKGRTFVDSFILNLVQYDVEEALQRRLSSDMLVASLEKLAPSWFFLLDGLSMYVQLRIREMSLASLITGVNIKDRIVGEIARTLKTTEELVLQELKSAFNSDPPKGG